MLAGAGYCLGKPTVLDRGPWFETVCGRKFYFLDPRPEDINIEELAISMSNQCRFGGHVNRFWSLASHSLLVSSLCPEKKKLGRLMHDSPEGVMGDVITPLKMLLPDYMAIYNPIAKMVEKKYNLNFEDPDIKKADNIALMTEKRDLRDFKSGIVWECREEPAPFKLVHDSIENTCRAFIKEFNRLYHGSSS